MKGLSWYVIKVKHLSLLMSQAKHSEYLQEVLVKFRIEHSHFRFHILIQNQGEDREHGVDR